MSQLYDLTYGKCCNFYHKYRMHFQRKYSRIVCVRGWWSSLTPRDYYIYEYFPTELSRYLQGYLRKGFPLSLSGVSGGSLCISRCRRRDASVKHSNEYGVTNWILFGVNFAYACAICARVCAHKLHCLMIIIIILG